MKNENRRKKRITFCLERQQVEKIQKESDDKLLNLSELGRKIIDFYYENNGDKMEDTNV